MIVTPRISSSRKSQDGDEVLLVLPQVFWKKQNHQSSSRSSMVIFSSMPLGPASPKKAVVSVSKIGWLTLFLFSSNFCFHFDSNASCLHFSKCFTWWMRSIPPIRAMPCILHPFVVQIFGVIVYCCIESFWGTGIVALNEAFFACQAAISSPSFVSLRLCGHTLDLLWLQ